MDNLMNQIYLITDLHIKQGNPKKVKIFINNDFFAETSCNVVADLGLSVNSSITRHTLELIQKENDLTEAKNDSLRFLSYRARSEWEVKKKLLDKEYPLYIIKKTLDWLKEKKFVDDWDFSLKWIEYQLSKKPVGKIKLRNELYKKGIDKEIIDKTIDSFFEKEDELGLAYQLIEKKYASAQLKKTKLEPKKIINLLKSRGFSNIVIEQIDDDFGTVGT